MRSKMEIETELKRLLKRAIYYDSRIIIERDNGNEKDAEIFLKLWNEITEKADSLEWVLSDTN